MPCPMLPVFECYALPLWPALRAIAALIAALNFRELAPDVEVRGQCLCTGYIVGLTSRIFIACFICPGTLTRNLLSMLVLALASSL